MNEHLQSGLSSEALAKLSALQLKEAGAPVSAKEKKSLKDKPFLDTLHEDPELEDRIIVAMDLLEKTGIDIPIFHVTSRAVRLVDGAEQSTGYLENIAANGFRAHDTNVAALMERSANTHIASPAYFKDFPYKFLRAMSTSLRHYAHHGSRTNKASLESQRDQGKGVSVMLVIDPTNVPLVPGTDYDDHFTLGEVMKPSRIMGMVELSGRNPADPAQVAQIAKEYIGAIEAYLTHRSANSTDNVIPTDNPQLEG